MLRLVAAGGRATEGEGVGPLGTGVVALGTRTLSEAGTVGSWSREQVRGWGGAERRRLCNDDACQSGCGMSHAWSGNSTVGLLLRPGRRPPSNLARACSPSATQS